MMSASLPNDTSDTSPISTDNSDSMDAVESATRDSELIVLCRNGDLDAFDALVAAHQDRTFNLCYWILGNREDAADAAQDAFVRAFRAIASFRGDSAFTTWLHRIAVNTALDVLERRKRVPVLFSDIDADTDRTNETADSVAHNNSGSTHTGDPATLAVQRERRGAVHMALADLPEHYRTALVLFDIEGHSYDEIAQILRLPLGTIKSRINRARLALGDRLSTARELFED